MITVGQEIAGIDMHSLLEVKSIYFQKKVLLLITVTTALIVLTLMAPGYLWLIPSFLLGLMYAHAIELQHQCLHNTAFYGRAWNRRVGVALGLPLLVSFSDYQNSHMRHHKLLGTPEDKEFFNYGYESLRSLRALIPHLFMVRHNRDVMVFIAKAVMANIARPDASTRIALRIRNEYRLMAVFLLTMAAVSIGFQTTIFIKLWVIPFLVGMPTHALIELPEHIGCDVQVTDILKNTRTIKASQFAVWFTDGNNYHVEHHWLPGVPNHKFPELHRLVSNGIQHLEISYSAFYWDFVKSLYRGGAKGRER